MARLRSAALRHGNITSSPDNSDGEPDPHHLDDEVLKADFLEGLPDEAEESSSPSSFHGNSDDGADSESFHEESEDGPSSQIQCEAQFGRLLGNKRKLTDEEQAAFMDSAALVPHRRGPPPLPSRSERRAASRDGHSTTSTPRSVKRPSHPEVHVVSVNSKLDHASASASAQPETQPETQSEDQRGSEGRQLRRSTRVQKPQKNKEDAEVAAPMSQVPQKRKPGPPRKTATAAEIITKCPKTDSANTGRPRSKTGEAKQPERGNRRIENNNTTITTPSSSKTSKSTPKKANTSSQKLSQMKSKRTNVQEAPDDEQSSDDPEEESARTLTIESHPAAPAYPPQIDGPDDLKEFLSEIWNNSKGVKKVRQQRDFNELEMHNPSSKGVWQVCSDIVSDIKDATKTSTELTDDKFAQVRDTIVSFTSDLGDFDLANRQEINNSLFEDLYAHIFPGLLRALCKTVDFYVQFFHEDDGSETIPTAQLEEIAFFMSAIIYLDRRAKSSMGEIGVKVKSSLLIVKPIRHHVIAPLTKCHGLLDRLIRTQTAREKRKQALQDEKRRSEQARIRREREAEEEDRRRALFGDWRRLHILRKDVEPDFHRWRHLDSVPPPSARESELIRDIDVNGQPFDRVVMFHHPRTNPRRHNLEMTQELIGDDWTDLECLTLMEALAKYTAMEFRNPRHKVYSKIIKNYCRPGDVLRRFSVFEIVQKSQYFKRMLEDREWTERIPTF